jgi:hypothetical protein
MEENKKRRLAAQTPNKLGQGQEGKKNDDPNYRVDDGACER